MTPQAAQDLGHIKSAINLFLKRGPKTKTGLNSMLTLIEDLCAVVRRQEGIPREDDHEDSTVGVSGDRGHDS